MILFHMLPKPHLRSGTAAYYLNRLYQTIQALPQMSQQLEK